jgi:hypothetical protein
MLEIGTSGLMSGEGKRAYWHRALPRLYLSQGKLPCNQRFAVRRESNFRKNLHLIENMAEQVVRWGSIRIAFCRAPSIGFLLV